MEQTTMADGQVLTHHNWSVCTGSPCPIHNPTDHEYREYPMDWSNEWGVMVRLIPVEGGVTRVIDPDEYRLRQKDAYLLENAAKCLECNERIVSTYRHDFVTCSCGNVSVDGGHDYARRVFGAGRWDDDSIYVGGE